MSFNVQRLKKQRGFHNRLFGQENGTGKGKGIELENARAFEKRETREKLGPSSKKKAAYENLVRYHYTNFERGGFTDPRPANYPFPNLLTRPHSIPGTDNPSGFR